MGAKKDEARFTIKFNLANPRHKEAMRILNEAGRSKATLIADAICMYIHYSAGTATDLIGNAKPACSPMQVQREVVPAAKENPPAIPVDAANHADDLWLAVNESLESFFGESMPSQHKNQKL